MEYFPNTFKINLLMLLWQVLILKVCYIKTTFYTENKIFFNINLKNYVSRKKFTKVKLVTLLQRIKKKINLFYIATDKICYLLA